MIFSYRQIKNMHGMLVNNGHKIEGNKKFSRGRIGFSVPNDSSPFDKDRLDAITESLYHGQYERINYDKPGTCFIRGCGAAGLTIFRCIGYIKNKLLVGENVAQAMQFTLSDNVDLAAILASYFLLPEINSKGRLFLISEQWHKPIQQYIVLLTGKGASVRQFYRHLFSDEPKIVIEKHGYLSNLVN